MAEQLNFTDFVLGVDDDGGGFDGAIYSLRGANVMTLDSAPKKVFETRDPNGNRSAVDPLQLTYRLTIEGEFHPSPVWQALIAGMLRTSSVAASTPSSGYATTTYTAANGAPQFWRFQVATEQGAENYDFSGCAMTALSLSWAVGSLPVFAAEFLIRTASIPEGLEAATIDTAHDIAATGSPRLIRVYARIGTKSGWGTLADHQHLAQSFAILFRRDLLHAQFDRRGRPSKYEWSTGIDISGRAQTVELNSGDMNNLILGDEEGMIRLITPNTDHADGFDVNIPNVKMRVTRPALKGDQWNNRMIEFVNTYQSTAAAGQVNYVAAI